MTRAGPRWLWTLRSRVTVVASLAITAAVVLGVLLMYLLQMSSVRRTIDSQLGTYATQIQQSAQNGSWPATLAPSTLVPNAEAQVIADDGHVLAATRTLQGTPALYVLPPGATAPVRQKAADGVIPTEVRVVALRAIVAGREVTIVAGTPTELLQQVNAEFVSHLLTGLPVILLLSAGSVWLVVGRALRPVERIRHAVTDITSAGLSQRVPDPGTPDEIGRLARTMNDMLARLEESAQRQRQFVADASHELRSPLAAIRTTLEVGLAHPDRAPWPAIAQRAAEQSLRLETLIQQLLLLARADERPDTGHQHPVDLGRLLHEIRDTSVTHDIDLTLDIGAGAVLPGSVENLGRLFRNIIDNAIRYATSTVSITARLQDGAVRVEVADDGPGIPDAERERVFGRFIRLDNSRNRGTGNSGLGLAIAREIATAHNGHIAIGESADGGALVMVHLTLSAD